MILRYKYNFIPMFAIPELPRREGRPLPHPRPKLVPLRFFQAGYGPGAWWGGPDGIEA